MLKWYFSCLFKDNSCRSIAISVWLVWNPCPRFACIAMSEVSPRIPTSWLHITPIPCWSGFWWRIIHVWHVPTHSMSHHLPTSSELRFTDAVSISFACNFFSKYFVWSCGKDASAPSIVESLVSNRTTITWGIVVIRSWKSFVCENAENRMLLAAFSISLVWVASTASPLSSPVGSSTWPCKRLPGESLVGWGLIKDQGKGYK